MLVSLFYSIAARQITHASLSSISLRSCGVFKDKSSVKTVLHMTPATKLFHKMRKKTRLDMKMLPGAKSVITDADHVHYFSADN